MVPTSMWHPIAAICYECGISVVILTPTNSSCSSFPSPSRPVNAHHVVQVKDDVVPEALCLCVQMGAHQREREAPHAQPSH